MVKGARKECPNCGYEALGNYCSMCGTKLIADEEIIVSSNMNQEQQNFFSRFKKRLNDEFIAIEKSTNLTPDEKVNRIIGTTSALCAGIAIQPIPFADMPI